MKCKNCQGEILSDAYFCIHCDHFIPAPEKGEKAGLFRRFVAASIDPLIGLFLYGFATLLFASFSPDSGATAALLFPFVYFIWFLTLLRQGKTPGKLLLGLQVVNHRHGENPGLPRMFLREIVGKFVSGLFFGLGYFWAIFGRNGQAWHDKIAGTVVLKVSRGLGQTASNGAASGTEATGLLRRTSGSEHAAPATDKTLFKRTAAMNTSTGESVQHFGTPLGSSWNAEPARSVGSRSLLNLGSADHVSDQADRSTNFSTNPLSEWAQRNRGLFLLGAGFLAGALAIYLLHVRSESADEAIEPVTSTVESSAPVKDTVRQLTERLDRLEQERAAEQPPLSAHPEVPVVTAPPTATRPPEPSVEAPAIAVGDRYTYETINLDNPKLNNIIEREVIGIANGIYVQRNINQTSGYTRILQFDQCWNLVSSGPAKGPDKKFKPYLKYFDFPLYVGKTWNGHSTETSISTGQKREYFIEAKVTARETVSVPSGTFETYKIVLKTELIEGAKRTQGTDVSWYAPAARRTVRSEIESQDRDTGRTEKKLIQLLSFQIR